MLCIRSFSLVYLLVMIFFGGPTWYRGVVIRLAHAFVICGIGWQVLPGIHPRMASETHGPTSTRTLEPPGFLGLNYGASTPSTVFVTHAIFGAFYK